MRKPRPGGRIAGPALRHEEQIPGRDQEPANAAGVVGAKLSEAEARSAIDKAGGLAKFLGLVKPNATIASLLASAKGLTAGLATARTAKLRTIP